MIIGKIAVSFFFSYGCALFENSIKTVFFEKHLILAWWVTFYSGNIGTAMCCFE